MEGDLFLANAKEDYFDLIFADTWPGKYHHLDEAIETLKIGGLYIIDHMIPEANWPDGHENKSKELIKILSTASNIVLTKLSWDSGLIVGTKTANNNYKLDR